MKRRERVEKKRPESGCLKQLDSGRENVRSYWGTRHKQIQVSIRRGAKQPENNSQGANAQSDNTEKES